MIHRQCHRRRTAYCTHAPLNLLIPQLLLQEWLLIEWPAGEAAPTKYWLSTLPADSKWNREVPSANV
jgi:hypothetical protein